MFVGRAWDPSRLKALLSNWLRRRLSVMATMRELNLQDSDTPRTIPKLRSVLGKPLDVVIVRFDGIGDWTLTLPLVEALVDSVDVGSVSVVAPPSHRALLERLDAVRYVAYEGGTTMQPRPSRIRGFGKLRAVSFLAQRTALNCGRAHSGSFDLAIVPRWDSDIGFNARAWALGVAAPMVGHDPACIPNVTAKEREESSILAMPVRDEGTSKHEIGHLVALMANLGLDTSIRSDYGSRFFGLSSRREVVNQESPYVALHPSASSAKREWPVSEWRAIVAALLGEGNRRITLIGSPSDAVRHEKIMDGFGPRISSSAGVTPLGELPALLASAESFIGNDSGPAHIAASVGVPVVVVSPHPADGNPSHANSPVRFAPWGKCVEVVQPRTALWPCRDACESSKPHCITQVTADQVLAAHSRVIARARS